MDIETRLQQTKQRLANILEQLSEAETRKQELLKEALRIDGELRLLNDIMAPDKENGR